MLLVCMYVCMYVCIYINPVSAWKSTYITGLWAVGQNNEALDYTSPLLAIKIRRAAATVTVAGS